MGKQDPAKGLKEGEGSPTKVTFGEKVVVEYAHPFVDSLRAKKG